MINPTNSVSVKAPLVSVLIVNYNGLRHLPECLDSLRNQTFQDFEVIVVDNASSDGSAEFLRRSFPEVKVVESAVNLGFSGGNNLGYAHCRGDFIYFLNNDIRAERDALEQLMALAQSRPGGVFASLLLRYAEPEMADSAGDTVYTCGKTFSFSGYPASMFTAPRHITSACAGAAVWPRAALEKIGLFDADFFLNYEDLDLSFRAQHAGIPILLAPASRIFHKGSATLGGKKSKLSLYYQERNFILFVLKNWPLPDLIRFLPALFFVKTWGLFDCLRFGYPGAWLRGNLAALLFIRGALRNRKGILGGSRLGPGGFRKLLRKNWLLEKIAYYRGRYDIPL